MNRARMRRSVNDIALAWRANAKIETSKPQRKVSEKFPLRCVCGRETVIEQLSAHKGKMNAAQHRREEEEEKRDTQKKR